MVRPIRARASAAALLLLVSLTACSDESDPNAPAIPETPQAVVVDLTDGHFSFLAPLGTGVRNGVFNPRIAPVVQICRLDTTQRPVASTPCASIVAWFGVDAGSSDVRVKLDTRQEMYHAFWHMGRYTLPTGYYRISIGTTPPGGVGTTLAFADVSVAATIKEARALGGPGIFASAATSDLPIKFRIEEGALCEAAECFEGSVGPSGGAFVLPDEFAGVEFPAGALDNTRTLVIERLTAADVPYCLPTRQQQYEGCYRYRLEPELLPGETFELEAVVGICLDPAAVPFEDQLVLQKWDEVDPATLTTLPRREIEFLECEDFSLASLDAAGTFSTLASAGGRFIGALVGAILPQPAYAGTRSPYGGGLNDFSRIGWVRPLSITIVDGNAQTACAASELSIDPLVLVTSTLTGAPVAGANVKFSLAAPGGALSTSQTTSDAFGFASTGWTLGGNAGFQAMLAVGRSSTAWPQYNLVAPNWGTAVFHATAQGCAVGED